MPNIYFKINEFRLNRLMQARDGTLQPLSQTLAKRDGRRWSADGSVGADTSVRVISQLHHS